MIPLTSSRDKKNPLTTFQLIFIVYAEGYLAASNLTQLSNSPAAGVIRRQTREGASLPGAPGTALLRKGHVDLGRQSKLSSRVPFVPREGR